MQSLWMLVAAFVFSLMAVCVKLVSDTYSTPEIVMYRSLIGAVFLFCMVLVKGGSFKTKYPLQHLWRGTVGATAFGLWFFSMSQLPLATSITLNYMSPIWIAAILFGIGLFHGRLQFEWRLALCNHRQFHRYIHSFAADSGRRSVVGRPDRFHIGHSGCAGVFAGKTSGQSGRAGISRRVLLLRHWNNRWSDYGRYCGSYARRGRHSFSRTFSFKCFYLVFIGVSPRSQMAHDAGLPSGQYACHGQPPIFRHRFFLHMGIADMER